MNLALIGDSGFVGSNLKNNYNFIHTYNSKNIHNIIEYEYDIVFCAAPSAVKWKANQNPIEDLNSIFEIIKVLKNVKTKKFILYSTIDVYGNSVGLQLNEQSCMSLNIHAYGKNRLIFESYVNDFFKSHIIRLPALFGNNLKKNIIFDLQNNNMLSNICLTSKFQWFSLDNIKFITDYVVNNDIKIFNCVTEPISTEEIIDEFFIDKKPFCLSNNTIIYDTKTAYFDKEYVFDKQKILLDLNKYLNK